LNYLRRVHISKATLSYLGEEFQVEEGEGYKRDSLLKSRNIITYLIIPVEKRVGLFFMKSFINILV
jgi:hypothetical protein